MLINTKQDVDNTLNKFGMNGKTHVESDGVLWIFINLPKGRIKMSLWRKRYFKFYDFIEDNLSKGIKRKIDLILD